MQSDSTNEKRILILMAHDFKLSRRSLLIGGAGRAASAGLVGCRGNRAQQTSTGSAAPIAAREFSLEARPVKLEIAPRRVVTAWTYDERLPGTELRMREGERVRVKLLNKLPEDTSIHWHGLPMRGSNNIDGVPFLTMPPIEHDKTFVGSGS